jgi:drug/metabolite transporter (DMT)-like permease
LITFGSFTFAVYVWLLSITTPAKISTYAYVNPIVALLLGSLIAEETISTWTLFCASTVIISVIIIITGKARKKDKIEQPIIVTQSSPIESCEKCIR